MDCFGKENQYGDGSKKWMYFSCFERSCSILHSYICYFGGVNNHSLENACIRRFFNGRHNDNIYCILFSGRVFSWKINERKTVFMGAGSRSGICCYLVSLIFRYRAGSGNADGPYSMGSIVMRWQWDVRGNGILAWLRISCCNLRVYKEKDFPILRQCAIIS